MAIEAATQAQREELQSIIEGDPQDQTRVHRLRRVYEDCGVFEKAEALVDKCRSKAEGLADEVENEKLRQLLYFLVDTVLAPEEDAGPKIEHQLMMSLPIAEMSRS